MITDKLITFFDDAAAAASASSSGLFFGNYPGRDETPYIIVDLKGTSSGNVTMTITVEESTTKTGTYTTAMTQTLTKDTKSSYIIFSLPKTMRGPYVRLSYTIGGGNHTGLKVFAAATQDMAAFYSAGQYIDSGRVIK